MPIYVFRCQSCGREREALLPISKAGQPIACMCGKLMQQIPAPTNAVFKGSGFYCTDARKKA